MRPKAAPGATIRVIHDLELTRVKQGENRGETEVHHWAKTGQYR